MPLHRQFHCKVCGCERTFWKHTQRHRTDAILTVVTLGLWGFVWLGKTIRHWRKPWRCRECASPRKPRKHRRHRGLLAPDVMMEIPIAIPVQQPADGPAIPREPRRATGPRAASAAKASKEDQSTSQN